MFTSLSRQMPPQGLACCPENSDTEHCQENRDGEKRPLETASATQESTRSASFCEMRGPMKVDSWRGSPLLSSLTALISLSLTSS